LWTKSRDSAKGEKMQSSDCVACRPVQSVRLQIKKSLQKPDDHPRKCVTQQFVARCLAAEKNGIVINHPAKEYFSNVLYNSIIKMVMKVCNKYTISCKAEVDDLVQECFLRIVKRIGTFRHEQALFTTWCWRVCSNTLNSRYQNHLRYLSRFTDDEHIETYSSKENSEVLAKDIAETIRIIAKKYPKKRKILYGMFGNPDRADFCLPTKVKISKVARAIGVKYSEAYTFYKKIVQETFKYRFAEGGANE
jgi:RNA polymerase sigma factor (sigma-70 family)